MSSHSDRDEKNRWFIQISSPPNPASPTGSIQSETSNDGPLPLERFFSRSLVER